MHVCGCARVRGRVSAPDQIDSVTSTVLIVEVLIQDTQSGHRGGAIGFRSGVATPSVDISRTTVQNATSNSGGSLFAEGADLIIDAAEFLDTTGQKQIKQTKTKKKQQQL